jgi:hypothetical protein
MKDLGPLNILRLPLYTLWEFPAIALKIEQESQTLAATFTKWLATYSPEVQDQLLAQIDWALAHPTYDFQSILKNVKTPSQEILTYFAFLRPVFAQAINNRLNG